MDQPLVLISVSLGLPWADGTEVGLLSFSIPQVCLSDLEEGVESASSTQRGIVDQLVVRLQERYTGRLSGSPAWTGAEVRVAKSAVRMNQVALYSCVPRWFVVRRLQGMVQDEGVESGILVEEFLSLSTQIQASIYAGYNNSAD